MFLKQYNYKPRSSSMSSQDSATDRVDNAAQADNPPAKTDAASQSVMATTTTTAAAAGSALSDAIAGRRRGSDASGKFSGLNKHKRSSQDEGAAARKASWAEQKPGQGGILGNMWQNFTKGS